MEKRLEKIVSIFLSLILVFSLSGQSSYAEDFGQYLPDTIDSGLYSDDSDEDDEKFLDAYSGERLSRKSRSPLDKSVEESDKQDDNFVLDSPKNKYEKARAEQSKSFTTATQEIAGTHDKTGNLKIKTKKDFLNQYHGGSKGSFGFSFIQDNFTYEDRDNVFEKTFRRDNDNDLDSDFNGILRLHGAKYFNQHWLKIGYGGAVGVGYNGGFGLFKTNGETSEAHIKLWTIPIEAFVDLSLDLTSYFQLNLQVAGSVMGLIQSRSDFEDGKKKKRRRQMGLGYAATGFLKFNLSKFIPKLGFNLLSSNSVNRYYLHLMIRNQSYANFKSEDLKISGTSFGLGFSLDYL